MDSSRARTPRTVIVTGGTAGVGRAVVVALARRGDRIGIIARGTDGLAATRAEVERLGGRALELPCDVADAAAVEAAADRVEREFGPIDLWINAAMSTVFSLVKDLEPAELRRVTEVTYLGSMHGVMAALRRMLPRNAGTIVQVGSSLAYRGIPVQAAYCGAKHAIKGFLDSLHAELLYLRSDVRLTTVHIPAVNTPQFDWARTRMGTQPRPVAPVFQPEGIAGHILEAADNPAREHWVGGSTPLVILGSFAAPGLADRYLAATAVKGQGTGDPLPADREDNLFEPVAGLHRAHGRFDAESKQIGPSLTAAAARLVAAGSLLALGGGLALAAAAGSRNGSARPGRAPRLRTAARVR